jgi:mycoredoxin
LKGEQFAGTTTREQTTMTPPAAGTVTMYSTSWCGYCRRLKAQLDRAGIGYEVVDIEQTPDAADYVMSVNGGNQTVPTILFPDGSAATNPSLAEVRSRLAGAA